jgi:hypothetical protein
MEHILPPGFGHIIGTLSSHAVVQRGLVTGKWPPLSTVSNKPAPSAPSGLHSGIGPTHFGKEQSGGSFTGEDARIALAIFGLRASCAWCNKVKSDLWFLQIIMKASMNTCEYDIYQNRITAFRNEIIRLLSDPDEQLFWSYELRFDVSLINSGDDKLMRKFGIMSAQRFADTCVDNITEEMDKLIKQGSEISNKCLKLPAPDGVNRLAIQIQLRTLMGYLVFWHDLLAKENKKMGGGGNRKIYEIEANVIQSSWSTFVNTFELISTKAFVPEEIESFRLADEEVQSSSSSSSSSSSNAVDAPILIRKKSSITIGKPSLLTRTVSTSLEQSTPIEVTPPPISRATSAAVSATASASAASAASASDTPSPKARLFTPPLVSSQSQGSQSQGLTPQSSSISFSRNMRAISQPAASRNSSSAASSAFATPLQSSPAAPTTFREIHNHNSLSAAPVLGKRRESSNNSEEISNGNNNNNNNNNNNGMENGKVTLYSVKGRTRQRLAKGGTRKQRNHRKHHNHHNHRTRKQKKNKKTRKIKKLTKRF